MALIEIDADDYAKLQREHAIGMQNKAIIDKISANPKTRREQLRLIKEVSPNTPIPELDATEPAMQALAEERKAREALEKRISDKEDADAKAARDSRVTGQVEAGRQLLAQRGYSKEGVDAIEKLMQEQGIANYDVAETYYAKTNTAPPADPIAGGYDRSWNGFAPDEGDDDHKLLLQGGRTLAGAKKFVNKQVQKTLQEMRGTQPRNAW